MPDLPIGDPSSFGAGGPADGPLGAPGHVPELTGRPDFAPRGGGGFMNPGMAEDAEFAGRPFVLDDLGYDAGIDGTQGQFFLFNEYKVDATPVREEWRVVAGASPEARQVPIGDGRCQPQAKVIEQRESGRWRLVLQRWEVRETSLSLQRWEDLAGGGPVKGAIGLLGASGATLAGGGGATMAGIAAGGAAAVAGGAGAAGAAGLGGLAFGDMIGREAGLIPETTRVIESGWIPVARWWDAEESSGETREAWRDDGAPVPCSGDAVGTNAGSGWQWPAAVAVVVLLVTGGLWFWFGSDDDGGDDNPDSMSEEEFEAIDTDGPDPTAATDEEPLPGLDDEEDEPPADDEQASAPGPTVPASNGPTTIRSFDYRQGSHVFTATVDGDGEAFAADESVRWYSWRFVVRTPDGDFVVDTKWSTGRDGRAFSADVWTGAEIGMGDLVPDAVVTAEWTSPDTVEIVADQVGIETPADSVTLELVARVLDDDGQHDFEDTVTWER